MVNPFQKISVEKTVPGRKITVVTVTEKQFQVGTETEKKLRFSFQVVTGTVFQLWVPFQHGTGTVFQLQLRQFFSCWNCFLTDFFKWANHTLHIFLRTHISIKIFEKIIFICAHHGTRRFYALWITDNLRYRGTVTTPIVRS